VRRKVRRSDVKGEKATFEQCQMGYRRKRKDPCMANKRKGRAGQDSGVCKPETAWGRQYVREKTVRCQAFN